MLRRKNTKAKSKKEREHSAKPQRDDQLLKKGRDSPDIKIDITEKSILRESAMALRERKEKHGRQYKEQKTGKKNRLQFDRLEADGSIKKDETVSQKIPESVKKEHKTPKRFDENNNQTDKTQKQVRQSKLQQEQRNQKKAGSIQQKKVENTQKIKHRIYFDDFSIKEKKNVAKKKSISKLRGVTGNVVHSRLRKEGEDNSAVQAAHMAEFSGEKIFVLGSRRKLRKQKKEIKQIRRQEKNILTATVDLEFQRYMEENPKIQHKILQRKLQRQRIKREYQKAYRAGKIAKENIETTINQVNTTTKVVRKIQEIFVRNTTVIISVGLLMVLLLFVMTGLSSCSMMFTNSVSNVVTASYIAEPEEIEMAEMYYTEMEAKLQEKINQMEAAYPEHDEYRYNIAAIGHDAHTLISYLTAKYGDFTFEQVKGELESLFEEQYGIAVEAISEDREETRTIQVGESLGNVVTSGYCNCRICCGIWSGGPTASGAMPQANHTIAVDASDPFLPMGTKVVMNGIEYTVEDTGNFARYGVQFDVYYGSHAAASAHGHRTWECFLAEGNANSVEVTKTVTVDVLNVAIIAKPLWSVIQSRLEGEQEAIYEMVYSSRGNLQEYVTPIELNWYSYINVPYGYSVNSFSGQMELHRGVDINVKLGTEVKSALEGTVIKTGYDNKYGNYVVIQDEDGVQIKYAYLQSISVEKGDTVTFDTIIGSTGSTGSATGSQLYLEVVKDGIYYNPVFYITTGEGGLYGSGIAYDDETVRRLFSEAERYLGMPYVWGGSSPATSFDCSGFVCYVFTNSGICNMGRTTAQGIYNMCTPVSPQDARPGDIIFFTGTYNAGEPVTHVGIYAGDGQMIHCGDPIQYTSIHSSYWQSHFYGFGRPN